jgi:Flp pilus assembly protein TadD
MWTKINAERVVVLIILFALLSIVMIHDLHAEECVAVAWLMTAQGDVEMRYGSDGLWKLAAKDQKFCQGMEVRVNGVGRASVRLVNDTLLRLDKNTTITFTKIQSEGRSILDLIKGALHAISRTPGTLDIRTPFVNAAIEGTEFIISSQDEASRVSVIEGRVVTSNNLGRVTLNKNESAEIPVDTAPFRSLSIKLRDASAWTLYYPPSIETDLVDASFAPISADMLTALEQYRAGKILLAYKTMSEIPGYLTDSKYHLFFAELNLRLGNLPLAKKHLAEASSEHPDSAEIYSLRALLAIVQGDERKAERLLVKAESLSPNSPVSFVVYSYLKQSTFQLEKALAYAEKAVALAPGSVLAHVRLAELLLMHGRDEEALQHAETASQINPKSSLAKVQLGFAALHKIDLKQAIASFEQAISINNNLPSAYFGKGLSLIRLNKIKLGRESLETAVLLDPSNALYRSYLGKAYYEENRYHLAEEQFELAKNLDSNDPTPWFYHSILQQAENKPVDALNNQKIALEKNNNRAVYRSRHLLDEDAAARTVSLARIYSDLGMQQLARSKAGTALSQDPQNHSAHRLLSDSYQGFVRNGASRESELLQAQLLQPLNLTPIQPILANSNFGLLDASGPGSLSYNEYNPMFVRNGGIAQIDGLVAEQGTLANDLVLAGLTNRFSYSLSQFHYETEGFQENSDYSLDSYNVFTQAALNQKLNLQFSLSHREEDKGDVTLRLLDSYRDEQQRFSLERQSYRLGMNFDFSNDSVFLGFLEYQESTSSEFNSASGDRLYSVDGYSQQETLRVGLQMQHSFDSKQLLAGLSTNKSEFSDIYFAEQTSNICPNEFGSGCMFVGNYNESQSNLYAYLFDYISSKLNVSYGLAYEEKKLQSSIRRRHGVFLPKIGLKWNPGKSDEIKLALFETYSAGRGSASPLTLEPTQFEGFNQLNDDQENTRSLNYGASWDGHLGVAAYSGIKVLFRDAKTRYLTVDREFNLRNTYSIVSGYFNWFVNSRLTVGVEFFDDRVMQPTVTLNNENVFSLDYITELETRAVPATVSFNHPKGLTSKVSLTYYDQKGRYVSTPDTVYRDHFWLMDLSVTYRSKMPKIIYSIGVKNLFDTAFRFEDQNTYEALRSPSTALPSVLPLGRVMFAKGAIVF